MKNIKGENTSYAPSFPVTGKKEQSLQKSNRDRLEKVFPKISILPALVLMIVVIAYPLGSLIYMSFTDTNSFNLISGEVSFRGFKNFTTLFRDGIFLKSIFNTFYFTVLSVFVEFILGLVLASTVYSMGKKSRNVIITLVLIPAMIADIAVGLVWKSLLDASTGVINYFIQLFGFPAVAFLSNEHTAMLTIIAISIWQWTPYMFLFALAGMESLNSNYFEVAKLEGASPIQTLYYVVLPLISPIILVAVFFRVTTSIRVFDKVFVLTGGGPGTATETISTYIQRVGFSNMEFGIASAGGIVMLLMAFSIGLISLKFMYTNNHV